MSFAGPGILFIGGWGRSGSTLLALLLGQVPGLVTVGEVREVWKRGLAENGACGCGRTFRTCDFWSAVGERAFGGWGRLPLDRVLRARYAVDRGWATPVLALPGTPLVHRRLALEYLDALSRLYGAIAEVSGASWIVDSSKLPSYALLVRRIPGADLRVLHLVRDSRGVAYSWQKHVSAEAGTDGRHLERYGPTPAALRYTAYNAATSALRHRGLPYLRMRYEDLVADPSASLERALALLGRTAREGFPFLTRDGVTLGPTHTADGNPIRFASGPMPIRLDDAWRRQMSLRHRRLVTILTAPSLASYGYRRRV